MRTTSDLDREAERLHCLTKELLRRYQFRDWNQICCYGISISQCHILDTLAEEGDLTMQQLARRMFKSVSTMTRVVAQLVRRRQAPPPEDRRGPCVHHPQEGHVGHQS
jgi:DNA-binding MarR family transcriptional regulator